MSTAFAAEGRQCHTAAKRSGRAWTTAKKTPERILSGADSMGRSAIRNAFAAPLKSECPEDDRADENKDGADGKRIESQGQVHLCCLRWSQTE